MPLFQEQLLRIAMIAANFTGGEAEELRRAMGFKRSQARMKEIEARLRSGMKHNGFAPEAQEQIILSISSFALYGFPESHAASFALLAYASAYLKCHYLAAFTAALLNNQPMGFYHPATIVKDAQRHGLKILPIDVTNPSRRNNLSVRLGTKEAGKHKVPPLAALGRDDRPSSTGEGAATSASATYLRSSIILVTAIMAIRSKSSTNAGTDLLDAPNGERERIFDAFRRWGYLEADLDPLGFLRPQLCAELRISGKSPRHVIIIAEALELNSPTSPIPNAAVGFRSAWNPNQRRSTSQKCSTC